jgi:Holliday junction resolvase RusA-like endonuclease
VITFTVHGLPAPQGSKRAIVNPHTKKVALLESSARVAPWRSDVRDAAIDALTLAYDGLPSPLPGPVAVELAFRFPRPQAHYLPVNSRRSRRALQPSAPIWPAGKPDLDKLARAVLDALTGLVWVDDAQVVDLGLRKRFADDEAVGLTATVTDLAAARAPLAFAVGDEEHHHSSTQLELLTAQED